jgi:hypothetical protein
MSFKTKRALVYLNGGDTCLHYLAGRNIREWEKEGKQENQKYMYTGGRLYRGEEDFVIVFDTKKWDDKEIERLEGLLDVIGHQGSPLAPRPNCGDHPQDRGNGDRTRTDHLIRMNIT